jgi:hypothetical protein
MQVKGETTISCMTHPLLVDERPCVTTIDEHHVRSTTGTASRSWGSGYFHRNLRLDLILI